MLSETSGVSVRATVLKEETVAARKWDSSGDGGVEVGV